MCISTRSPPVPRAMGIQFAHLLRRVVLHTAIFRIVCAFESPSFLFASSASLHRFYELSRHRSKTNSKIALCSAFDSSKIELQSDDTKFGRGDFHLSALIEEGDVVVYQTGSWLVDGVVVGEDGAIPSFALAKIDNVQVVWTHNCEHGVLRGMEVTMDPKDNTRVLVSEPLKDVEFGPEQLLARLPVSWEEETSVAGISSVPLEAGLWW